MKDFTLALVQHNSILGKTADNLKQTIDWTRKAKKKKADLVCFPELNITAHGGDASMIRDAQAVPDGEAVSTLTDLAKELNIYICAGIAEKEGSAVYNTQFIVGPGEFVGKQRKVHLSSDEYFLFRHGTQLPVFDLPFAKVGMIICYDNEHPEPARCQTIDGAELLLAPHASRFGDWPRAAEKRKAAVKRQKDHWSMVHRCRANDNGAYVALCNTAGQSAQGIGGVQANHAGACMIVGPSGEVIAQSKTKDIKDELVVVNLKAAPLIAKRERHCYPLRTRRIEAFSALTRPTV